jgi:uncharacterized protein YecE (DUF72 family)
MILIGASGYGHDDWVGRFYPEQMPVDDSMAQYAQDFSIVELVSTYHKIPAAVELAKLPTLVPESFAFSVLAHESLLAGELEDVGRFRAGLEPLIETGQLVCIVAPFPQSFEQSSENQELLLRLRDALTGLQLVVEFTNGSWIAEGLSNWLQAHGLCYCCVDLPRLSGLTQPVCWVTGPVAYARFHGRNRAAWQAGASHAERHDYRYDPLELAEWLPKVEQMARSTTTAVVCFCNTPKAQAVESARLLRRMIRAE